MAKWHGIIGFAESVETSPGIFTSTIVERKYVGEAIRISQNMQYSTSVEGGIRPRVQLRLLCDNYALDHISEMKFIEYAGKIWFVSDFDFVYPNITLNIGGVYNGKRSGTASK